jgi:hypothetical protein
MRPYLEKQPISKKRLVEWLKVWTLSSSPALQNNNNKKT